MGLFKRAGKGVAAAGAARGNWRTWRRRSCLLIGAVVLLPGPMFIGGVALQIYEVLVQRDIDALEASIRAKGEPVTMDELEAYYPKVPEAENGALIYLKAMDALKAIDDEDVQSSDLYIMGDRIKDKKYSLETMSAVRALLAAREPVFTILSDALNYARFHYPLDLSVLNNEGPADLSMRYVHRLDKLLWIQGFIALHDRDWEAFAKNQWSHLHFFESLSVIPSWQSYVGWRVGTNARELARLAVSTEEAPASLAETLDPLYVRIDTATVLRARTIGARCQRPARLDAYCQGEIEIPYQEYLPLRAKWMRFAWLPGSDCVALREKQRVLQFTTAIIDDHGKPLRERFANSIARQPYDRRWDFTWVKRSYNSDGTWVSGPMSLGDILKHLFNPELHVWLTEEHPWFMFVDNTADATYEEIQIGAIRMALLINGYRQKTGEFPANAELLGPGVVADPYDGAPLRFKPVEGGFMVYSVGDDLIDHGGVMGSEEGSDIVVEFVRDSRVVPEKDPPRGPGRSGPLGGSGARARWVSGG